MSLLASLGLSPEAKAQRIRSIGGSDSTIIMSGDDAAVLALWETKTGRRAPDDLSGVLPVVMGSFTEPLNVAWFEKQTGHVVNQRGDAGCCQRDTWRTATLDGMVLPHLPDPGDYVTPLGIFEAKHVNAFGKAEETLAKYQAQLHHNMDVWGQRKAFLSIFRGNADWVLFEVERDEAYAAAVRKAEYAFWMAVQADEPPVAYPAPPPPKAAAVREVDMTGSNAWASLAADYLETKDAATKHDKAKDGLKKLVEADVSKAWGHGLEVTRDKRGALRFAVTEG